MTQANAIIGQSGGPTSVINSSLIGIVDAAMESPKIGKVFGMRFGIEGVLQNQDRVVSVKARRVSPLRFGAGSAMNVNN